MKLLVSVLCLVCVVAICAAQADGPQKRKKLRRKLPEVNLPAENVTLSEQQQQQEQEQEQEVIEIKPSQPEIASKDDDETTERAGRGFLDDYYSKFEDRVEVSQIDKTRGNERMDSPTSSGLAQLSNLLTGIDVSEVSEDVDNDVTKLPAEHRSITPGEFRNFPFEKSQFSKSPSASSSSSSGFSASMLKKAAPSPISLLLSSASGSASPIMNEYGGEGRYMQQVTLPKHLPGDKSYMFSAMPVDNELASSSSTSEKSKRKTMNNNMIPPSDKYEMSGIESLLSGPPSGAEKGYMSSSSSFESVGYDPVPADTRDPMSKFFGLTGTTSHDIQLGLTFTVPFLSIPLNAINSMFNGDGLSDMMDFNFSTTSLVTVAILGILAIFILPQIIYWLTGVNLSAFNWGRNDDDHAGIQLTSLAHTVDEALLRYDIDTRTCLARTMCTEYQKRADDTQTSGRLSRGILENIAENNLVKKYIGESRITEALGLGSSGKNCSDFYSRDVCPWDTSAMIKIASKVMSSGNIDFASIATAAATAAASSMAASGAGAKK